MIIDLRFMMFYISQIIFLFVLLGLVQGVGYVNCQFGYSTINLIACGVYLL